MKSNNKGKNDFRKNGKSSRRESKSGKQNRTFERKEERFDEEAVKGKTRGSNDSSWYGAGSALMQNAAAIPFSNLLGLPVTARMWEGSNGVPIDIRPAGIMRLDYMPTMGMMKDWASPYNVMIRDIYTFVRHANSGHSNYDAADLGSYFIAYDSICCFYAYMVRLYGLMHTTLVRNRYTPANIVYAMDADYSDLATKLADFRYYINSFAARFSAMKVPASLNIIRRHMWMNTNVYMDSPVETGQMYFFHPTAFWKYIITDTEAHFEPVNVPIGGLSEIVALGDELLNSILNSEDFNIMSGDIMKAYGEGVFTVNMIEPDFRVVPVFDPEILMQIHNATILHQPDVSTWRIQEDTSETTNVGALVSNFYVNVSGPDGAGGIEWSPANLSLSIDRVCDMPVERPTPENVAVATRLMAMSTEPSCTVTKAVNMVPVDIHGSEIIVDAAVFTMSNDGLHIDLPYHMDPHVSIEAFNAHPYRYRFVNSMHQNVTIINADTIFIDYIVDGDFDNVAIIDASSLRDIHEAASYGLFGLVK